MSIRKEVTQEDVKQAIALMDLDKARDLQYRLEKQERAKGRQDVPVTPRIDVGEHIRSAFKGLPVGTFLRLAELRAHRSEASHNREVGVGAMSARLFPARGDSTIPGIEGAVESGLKGARNTEVIS